jgi:hypothetical protein
VAKKQKSQKKQRKALVTSDDDYMGWLVEARTRVQRMLLDLYGLTKQFPGAKNREDLIFLDLAVGAAFSLWRAVFLGDTPRDLTARLEALQRHKRAFIAQGMSRNVRGLVRMRLRIWGSGVRISSGAPIKVTTDQRNNAAVILAPQSHI